MILCQNNFHILSGHQCNCTVSIQERQSVWIALQRLPTTYFSDGEHSRDERKMIKISFITMHELVVGSDGNMAITTVPLAGRPPGRSLQVVFQILSSKPPSASIFSSRGVNFFKQAQENKTHLHVFDPDTEPDQTWICLRISFDVVFDERLYRPQARSRLTRIMVGVSQSNRQGHSLQNTSMNAEEVSHTPHSSTRR